MRSRSNVHRSTAWFSIRATLPGIPLYQELRVDVAPRALEGVQPSPNDDPLTWNAFQWRFAANVN